MLLRLALKLLFPLHLLKFHGVYQQDDRDRQATIIPHFTAGQASPVKDGMQQAREIAGWKARLRERWPEVEITSVTRLGPDLRIDAIPKENG